MFKNLTPHTVNIDTLNGELVLEPSGVCPRVSTIEKPECIFEGVEIFSLIYGSVEDLPDPEEGVYLIVSKMVRDARMDRPDLFYPTRLKRDEAGRIVGCGGLAH